MSLKRTPLYPMHLKHNGKIIDFGGWELPVQYEGMGIIKEHNMVREKAGLFDVSHMGEITIIGEQAEQMVQKLVTNDVKSMQDFQVMYSPMCYPSGGVVDDLLVYRYDSKNYLLVVNAANTDKDYEWIQQNLIPGVEASNRSSEYAQLALQGPAAQDILQKLTTLDLNTIRFFWFNPQVNISGVDCLVSRTGYTGEDGFEIYVEPQLLEEIKTGKIDYLTFTSSSTVSNFVEMMGRDMPVNSSVKIACIGPITAGKARELGFKVDIIAGQYTIDGLLQAIIQDATGQRREVKDSEIQC
jgi:glycine cleavage system T protein